MNSIPLEVLMQIEDERPELAPLIHDLVSIDAADAARVMEKRLASAYFSGPCEALPPEEQLKLLACCAGRPYGEGDRSLLH